MIQSHVYIEKRYNNLKYTPAGPTAPKIQAPDTSSNLIPEANEQMFESTNKTCNTNNRSHRFSRSAYSVVMQPDKGKEILMISSVISSDLSPNKVT